MCVGCEERDEEIRQLKEKLYGTGWECPHEFGLGPSQVRMLAALVKHPRVLPKWFLFDASRGDNTTAEVEVGHIISVQVYLMRRKLARFGIDIQSFKYAGYRLTDASRQRLLNWNTQVEQAA